MKKYLDNRPWNASCISNTPAESIVDAAVNFYYSETATLSEINDTSFISLDPGQAENSSLCSSVLITYFSKDTK